MGKIDEASVTVENEDCVLRADNLKEDKPKRERPQRETPSKRTVK